MPPITSLDRLFGVDGPIGSVWLGFFPYIVVVMNKIHAKCARVIGFFI
jgi:hypothetical protein